MATVDTAIECCDLSLMDADLAKLTHAPRACASCARKRREVSRSHRKHTYSHFWCTRCNPNIRGPRQGWKPCKE